MLHARARVRTPNSMPAARLIWKASEQEEEEQHHHQNKSISWSAITSCVRLLIFHHVANDDKSLGNEERWLAWMAQAGHSGGACRPGSIITLAKEAFFL